MAFSSLSRLFLELSVAAGSAEAANMERGSVPSSTLLSGSTTELEDDEDVEEELPFRLTFLVFDSVTQSVSLDRQHLHHQGAAPICRLSGSPGTYCIRNLIFTSLSGLPRGDEGRGRVMKWGP